MEYKGFILESDASGSYIAIHIRRNGLIVHTTSYFTNASYAVTNALRWIDKL